MCWEGPGIKLRVCAPSWVEEGEREEGCWGFRRCRSLYPHGESSPIFTRPRKATHTEARLFPHPPHAQMVAQPLILAFRAFKVFFVLGAVPRYSSSISLTQNEISEYMLSQEARQPCWRLLGIDVGPGLLR